MIKFLTDIKAKLTAAVGHAVLIWAGMIFLAGAVFAMDGRIDQRVGIAIDELEVRQIHQKIDFLIMKEQLAPQSMTSDDKVNKVILEKQLERRMQK